MEQIRRRLTHITAASDQDPRHVAVAVSLRRDVSCACIIVSASRRGCDFNFFKHVFLESANLFETDELQEREKSYYDFHTRHGIPKQIGKPQPRAICDSLQNNINL